MVLVQLHALKGRSATNELVGEFGLVLITTTAVHLLVRVLRFVCKEII